MRDASVRRRFEKEVELTLAWEAEKMIVVGLYILLIFLLLLLNSFE